MENPEQLRILPIFHYVVGGLHGLFGCFGLLHLGFGIAMLADPSGWSGKGSAPPPFFAWMFVAMGGGWVLFGLTLGIVTALSGRFISQRKHRTFSIVIGGLNCAMVPFGTALGIFTLILLTRKDVTLEYPTRSHD